MATLWQEKLQTLLKCDLKSLYPLARSLNRKLYFYVGPTNSGKTFQATQKLKGADCGIYLAPLRLLALEGFEKLREDKIKASLVTGEEQVIDDEATHICSTIEMLDFNLELDCAVIDEVQMIDDIDRGWSWVNAIIGTPAKEIYMTGSVNSLEAIKKIAIYLNESLEITKFQRKNPLEVLDSPVKLEDIKKQSALIAFSRTQVLSLKAKLSKKYSISVIYGNLSPEVRRHEAKRFREGKSEILIATDAIAMGLNLPIETIIFTDEKKFDGKEKRLLKANEVVQIAGRAGRYGMFEAGHITGLNKKILNHIKVCMDEPIKTIKAPFRVKASIEQVQSLAVYLNNSSISAILSFFAKNMKFNGPFKATNISSMIEVSKIIDKKSSLSLDDKYLLVNAPVYLKSQTLSYAFEDYTKALIKKKMVKYCLELSLKHKTISPKELLLLEDEVKKISLYLWFAYKLPLLFPDIDKALEAREVLNAYIGKMLKEGKFHVPKKKFTSSYDRNKSKDKYKNPKSYTSKSKKGHKNKAKEESTQEKFFQKEKTSKTAPRKKYFKNNKKPI